MKIGLMHLTPYSKADPALVAKRAEELGFESYWVGDHTIIPITSSVQYPGARDGHVPDFLWQLPDPLLALARAGATTSRIKLGTGVCLVPERNPILTAKQVATLDDSSGGRVLFQKVTSGDLPASLPLADHRPRVHSTATPSWCDWSQRVLWWNERNDADVPPKLDTDSQLSQ
jgi:alkanesulfonate monooxygenase SsuD/methylene tetrahydromethanopterin reductase-like flavin-dependent oxidoreductase (luciferase family)